MLTVGNAQPADGHRDDAITLENWLAELKKEKITKAMKREYRYKIALAADRAFLWFFFTLIVLGVIVLALLIIVQSITQPDNLQLKG